MCHRPMQIIPSRDRGIRTNSFTPDLRLSCPPSPSLTPRRASPGTCGRAPPAVVRHDDDMGSAGDKPRKQRHPLPEGAEVRGAQQLSDSGPDRWKWTGRSLRRPFRPRFRWQGPSQPGPPRAGVSQAAGNAPEGSQLIQGSRLTAASGTRRGASSFAPATSPRFPGRPSGRRGGNPGRTGTPAGAGVPPGPSSRPLRQW